MPYKEPCGFRKRIAACKFNDCDCSPDKCDMFNIEWTSDSIKKQLEKEQQSVRDVHKRMGELRFERKTKEQEYIELKKKLADLCYGCVILAKAYTSAKRSGK